MLDKNDHSPYFSPRNYFVTVQEDAAEGTVVLILEAKDDDASSLFREIADFVMVTDEEEVPFTVSSDGSISVSGGLDYDLGSRVYIIEVIALDGGGLTSPTPARVTIELLNVSRPTTCLPDQPVPCLCNRELLTRHTSHSCAGCSCGWR